ncbi:MAG: CBS domain-containing protein [Nitrososphaerales archaeon]|jgi:CBS domain-containing protein
MTGTVRTIPVKATIRMAAKEMARWKIGSLVIADGSRPVGIVTEGDISKAVARGLDPAKALVSIQRKKLVTVEPGERIEVAAKMMASAGVKKLPVMEGTKLVGMLTQTDIVNSSFALVTSLKEMVQARYRPPDFEM